MQERRIYVFLSCRLTKHDKQIQLTSRVMKLEKKYA